MGEGLGKDLGLLSFWRYKQTKDTIKAQKFVNLDYKWKFWNQIWICNDVILIFM